MIGFDYTERIAPAALKVAGCSVAIRYTTWSGWPKSLTPGEADELHAAGFPIAANFESTADRMLGGAAAGHADAVEARGHLGDDHMPTGLKIWFSADWDVQPAEVSAVLDYLHAAADVLGSKNLVGCYGGLRAVAAAADAGFGIWQTVAWSGSRWDPRAVARQTGEQRIVGGVQVDVNEIIDLAALGAWGGPTSGGTMAVLDNSDARTVWAYSHGDAPDVHQTLDNAAAWAGQANAKLDQVLAHLGTPPAIDVNALGAAVASHLSGGGAPTADAIAAAISAHLTLTVGAK